jgi:hypothetical protein
VACLAALSGFHAEIRGGKKAGIVVGVTGRADHIFGDFPDFVENIINGSAIGTLVVIDRHYSFVSSSGRK